MRVILFYSNLYSNLYILSKTYNKNNNREVSKIKELYKDKTTVFKKGTSNNYAVQIPARLRDQLKIKKQDKIIWHTCLDEENKIRILIEKEDKQL